MIRDKPRRGMALVVALVALAIFTMLSAVLMKSMLMQRRQVQDNERAAQAMWLVEAGLQRARARLVSDPDFTEERWELNAEALGGRYAALVTIAAYRIEGKPDQRRIAVEAEYPRGEVFQARSSREITVEMGRAPRGDTQ